SDSGEYSPRNGSFFSFANEINELYDSADLIITHAGAGSIYTLLEMNKKIIIVPNFERVDKHQSDIANYMAINKHALVCSDVADIGRFIEMTKGFQFVPFEKISFFKSEEISEFIMS
ncbi:PssE/Cps14G family polysaccharide biosynthesis glycosyltransferase, partial [Shewanella livingstonensis]